MSRYPGGIITKNPITPAGPNPTGAAPGIWRMEDVAYWLKQGVWPDASADAYWPYVAMLLSTTSLNGAQNNTFLDSSPNNFTITRNGNTTQGSFTPYGSLWSNYFDGSGDYFTLPYTAANFDWFTSGTDFTIEYWFFATSSTGISYSDAGINHSTVIGNRSATSTTDYWSFGPTSAGTVTFYYYNGSGNGVTSTATYSLNTWNHVAMTKTSSGITIFVNGVAGTTTAISGTPQSSTGVPLTVGQGNNSSFNGYVSNLRIVRGTAIYSGNFTVPTAPLTAVTNTTLLTCQSNRFRDASANNFAITRNGDVRVTPFSPYAPTAPYSATANGGSMYFDGSGDYLSLPTAAGVIGTGDFTVEAWFKSNVSTAPTHCPIIANYEANSNGSWAVKASAGSNQCLSFAYYNSGWNDLNTSLNISSDLAWHHVAVTRSGTTLRIYADGVLINSWTVTASLGGNGYTLQIGRIANDDAYTNGFISDARLVVGTALYTGSTYTVPTAPLTAISGTKFLVGGRNAAIFDSAADNDLETVGNAQVSTAQSKFGTGSMAFDGSGDYLSVPSAPSLIFSGSFTIEFWINFSSVPSSYIALMAGTSANTQLFITTKINGNGLRFGLTGVAEYAAATQTWTSGTWYHVALVRNGTDVKFYVNGTNVSDSTYTNSTTYSGAMLIGGNVSGTVDFPGYIDDLRITKGVARYTANFTPPTAAFPTY